MIKKIVILAILFFALGSDSRAQLLNHKLGEFLVQFDKEVSPNEILPYLTDYQGNLVAFNLETIAADLNIHKVTIDYAITNEYEYLAALRNNNSILAAQFNHIAKKRDRIPNDSRWNRMWHLRNIGQETGSTVDADIDAELAWDISTGGLTALGDTIVVAVIDTGTDLNHYDLKSTLWINRGEIPNNNIDDDQNGYKDDYYGYNTDLNNGSVQITSGIDHGLNINALIGAQGNNSTGMTGVNWNIKIITIKELSDTESEIIEAYEYARKLRLLYNQTNGAKGAFIVATNSSFGLDEMFENDVPIWCGYYNALGEVGILNIGATANNDVNVDVVGDIPSLCSSEHLVAVTASNWDDERTFSGYGIKNVDLAAPGEDVYTLHQNNQYFQTSGTSFSTPLVVGAVGLMYSVPSLGLITLAKQDPAAASLLVKKMILESVDKKVNLLSDCVSGGRLNLFGAMQAALAYTGDCKANCLSKGNSLKSVLDSFNINSSGVVFRSDTSGYALKSQFTTSLKEAMNYNYQILLPKTIDTIGKRHVYIWTDLNRDGVFDPNVEKSVGRVVQNTSKVTGTLNIPWNINGGTARMRMSIKPFTSLDSIAPYPCDTFTTGGVADLCIELLERICPTADSIQVTNLTPTSATLRWTSIMDGIAYLYRYKKKGTSMWMDKADTTQSFNISGLSECTEYEFQVKTICAFDTSAYTSTLVFKTTGTGCPVSTVSILPDDILAVYPNPFSDKVNLQFMQDPFGGQDFKIKCINVHGQLIFSKSMNSSSSHQNSTINIGTEFELQNQGVYFLIIESQDKRILKKLIKY